MTMDLEKLILVFIKAQRTCDFQLYVAAWLGMMKYIFALDHTHYCRWSSIENFDLLRMETILPTIFDEFMCGHFVA
jgi:hypothetical protein